MQPPIPPGLRLKRHRTSATQILKDQTCGTVSLCHGKISKTTVLMANSHGQKFFHICCRRNRICIHASLKFMSLQPCPVAKTGCFLGGELVTFRQNIDEKTQHWDLKSLLMNASFIEDASKSIIVTLSLPPANEIRGLQGRNGAMKISKAKGEPLTELQGFMISMVRPALLLESLSRSFVEIKKMRRKKRGSVFRTKLFRRTCLYIYPK